MGNYKVINIVNVHKKLAIILNVQKSVETCYLKKLQFNIDY